MKKLRKHLKLIALFLAVTFLLQSCSVYKTVEYETAVKSGKKVKVTLNDNKSYKFIKIFEQDSELIGVANKSNSARINKGTASNINVKPESENSKYKNYSLNKDEILKLKQVSPIPSILATIVFIPIVFIGLIGVGAIIAGGIAIGPGG